MCKRKGGQVRHGEAGTRILNVLSAVMKSAGMGFSSAHNARYGLQEWLAILAGTCSQSLTAAAAVRNLRNARDMPTEKWFRNMMNAISPDVEEAVCGMMIRRAVRLAKKRGMGRNGSVLVAVDKHLIGRFDKNNMKHLIYSKWKNGTSRFEAYAAVQVVAEPVNAVLDCVRVARGSSDAGFVRKFVHTLRDYKVRARLILPDREFYSVDVMNAPSASGNRYLMPAVKSIGVKRAIGEYRHGLRSAASRYVMRNAAGRYERFVLIIRPAAGPDGGRGRKTGRIADKYIVFAANLPMGRAQLGILTLPEEYRRRWGIETAYRQVEEVRPWTTSRSGTFRMILFFTSLFMYNMWATEHARRGTDPREATLRALAYSAALAAACNIIKHPFDPGGPG